MGVSKAACNLAEGSAIEYNTSQMFPWAEVSLKQFFGSWPKLGCTFKDDCPAAMIENRSLLTAIHNSRSLGVKKYFSVDRWEAAQASAPSFHS